MSEPGKGDRFGEIAIELKLIQPSDLSEALRRQAVSQVEKNRKLIGDILVEMHILDLRRVQRVLLEQKRRREAKAPAAGMADSMVSSKRFGDFELLARIGEGGMGAVYKARDMTGRMVALKVLNKDIAGDSEFIKRFQREAKAGGALNHPNIVQAYAAGEEKGRPFLAMEFVDGESLRARLRRKGRLPEKEALAITRGVAAGLAHAHSHSFIHRDIKPDNVLLGSDGSVKVVDLGLAKSLEDDQRLTKTGIALGTPHYISPEQARGQKEVDHRCDIYSLGATLYLLLTGQVPFDGSTNAEIMLKHLKEELDNPQDIVPEISDGTVMIISRMMAKKPEDRYANCLQLIEDLDLVLMDQPTKHTTDALAQSSIRPPQRRRARAGAHKSSSGCMVILLAFSGAIVAGIEVARRLV
jgi:eukaryotic-like serine/threonine-protein kinase